MPNTFKETVGSPQAAHWQAESYNAITNLEKPGVYELVTIAAVPVGRSVVGTR